MHTNMAREQIKDELNFRFQKCLSIGMKPNWVLSDEQCNIRFRRVRQEKGADKEVKVKKEVEELSRDSSGNINQDEVIVIKREQESPVSTSESLKIFF